MGTLQGTFIYPSVCTKQELHALPLKNRWLLRSGFWECKERCRVGTGALPFFLQSKRIRMWKVHSSFSSSNDNDSMEENFNNDGEEYVNSSVVEAVEVKSGADGFMIKMRNGRQHRCVHNDPRAGYLPEYEPHPAIVLKMEDGSDLLLPIITLEVPSVLLMAAVCNVRIARPTLYQTMKEMIANMGYTVKLVRITKRVHEAYFSQLILAKVGQETERISFDLRPSDAINIAVRCKVPIQVSKSLAYSDGVRIVKPPRLATQSELSDAFLSSKLDRPDGEPCYEAEEFVFVRNMLIAAVEERYRDAAEWRNKLIQLRSKKRS